MSFLFLPHPPYAEDQRFSRTILSWHVLRSGLAFGSTLSIFTSALKTLYSGPRTLTLFSRTLFLHASYGSIYGVVGSGIMMIIRMWGREDIEWKDRAWRLLENSGQTECDRWIVGGSTLGAAVAILAARRGKLPVVKGSQAMTGLAGAGVGSVAGTVGYMAWRYGIKGESMS